MVRMLGKRDYGNVNNQAIRNIAEWMDRDHTKAKYYLTRFSTEHRYFTAFLTGMQKVKSPAYPY